jgi:hypothetical protein
MSWLEELSELERRAQARRAELAPQVASVESLLAEFDEVNQLLDRLSRQRAGEAPVSEPKSEPPAATVTAKPARRATRKPAARKPRPTRPAARKAAAGASPARKTNAAASSARTPAASATAARRAASGSAPAKPAPSRGRRNAARPGERERQLLELVAARPGITVSQVAGELGVDATGLYGIVRRLQGKGRLRKDGPALTIISAATETIAAAGAA